MTLQCELDGNPPEALAAKIGDSLREVCKLRGEVAFRQRGALPNDGKVIEDLRKYD
jgi:phenylacetate-CoA ligase